jgi:uncharacterized phage-like protein YoqJ
MILGVTGHRPDKLYGKIEAVEVAVAVKLAELKPSLVRIGMAVGTDMIAAAKCIGLGIPFTAVIPFAGQEKKWPERVQQEYKRLLSYAADVVVVSRGDYSFEKMHKRNRWIVDHSSKLLSVWNGTLGGTYNTVMYAMKRGWKLGERIINIDPRVL